MSCTSGIDHIFNRMFINTGLKEFKYTAEYWFSKTLEMAKYEDGIAGYKVWRTTEYGGLQNKLGFLESIAGIGLSLISAFSISNQNGMNAFYYLNLSVDNYVDIVNQ